MSETFILKSVLGSFSNQSTNTANDCKTFNMAPSTGFLHNIVSYLS